VTDAHLKTHKKSRKAYDKLVAELPQQAWDFYWMDMNDYLRRLYKGDPVNGVATAFHHPLVKNGLNTFKKFLRQFHGKYGLQDCAGIQT
jgi:hypothetical protein